MANLQPFHALRYDPATVGDVAAVVAPPYDVIDEAQRERLYARSPYNAVRLILNREADPYGAAARTLAEWRASGVLVPDTLPALYLYAQRFPMPGGALRERIGVVGALQIERFESGRVRPHERTLAKAKEDRLALLRACRTSLSPIFGLVSAPEWRLAELVPDASPLIDVGDESGARDRVWPLTDPALIAAVAERLGPKEIFIADGHHRYETALRYRDEVRAGLGAGAPPLGAAPYDYVLAYLTTMEDPGLVILATHRILRSSPLGPVALREALAHSFAVAELPWSAAGLARLLGQLEAEGGRREAQPTVHFGAAVAGAGRLWLLSAPTRALPFPPELPPALRALDVSALHQVVLARVLGLPIGDRGGAPGLGYTQDAERAFAAVTGAEAAAAFFLPPTSIDDLRTVSLVGLTMPEKSTYFHPKLLTGLVVYPLDGAPTLADPGARR